jgi:hypothetical protein
MSQDEWMTHPLQPIREYYLDCFRQGLADARKEFDELASELLLELPHLKYDEYVYRLYRVDIIGKQRGETRIREVNVSEREAADWRHAVPSGVEIATPLLWYGVEFDVRGSEIPENTILSWASRWLDISDDRYDESAEFQEVIHSITPPAPSVGGFRISVDFGSAPTTAFDQLLEILTGSNAAVSVGSFFLYEAEGITERKS